MANPVINNNQKTVNPTLADLIALSKKQVMLELNCHAIATVQALNVENQTVSVTINYKKSILRANPDGTYSRILMDYPPIIEAPIVILSGGTAGLTFPITQGDECILLFNDRAIDTWFQSGQTTELPSPRLHSFADAIALVGLRSLARSLSNYDTTHALLFNGTTKVGVSPTKVLVENETQNLNDLLQQLTTQLQNLTTALAALTVTGVTTGAGVSGPPANAATITTIGTNIGTIATNIGNLLE